MRIASAALRDEMAAIRVMTGQEQHDISAIARSVARLETSLGNLDQRIERLEKFADRAEGALTLMKFAASLLGIGGIAAIITMFSRGGP